MSSRQEEKERRKRERQEREAAESASAARRRRMQMVFGGGLAAVAVIAVVVVVVFLTGGSGNASDNVPAGSAAIPAQKESDLKKAAAAAGCTLKNPANEGAGHIEKTFKASDYKQNPPTSGNHFPQWYPDGVYAPGDTPELGQLVHTLEHGRIDVQYAPDTSVAVRKQLEAFVAENGGYHMVMYRNDTHMPFAVAATAWDQMVGCPTVNDKTWDALRTFRDRYIDKGPEVGL
jgi:hypothetical protein